jgi:hypothetical protein
VLPLFASASAYLRVSLCTQQHCSAYAHAHALSYPRMSFSVLCAVQPVSCRLDSSNCHFTFIMCCMAAVCCVLSCTLHSHAHCYYGLPACVYMRRIVRVDMVSMCLRVCLCAHMYWCLLVCRVARSHVSPSDPTGARQIEQRYVSCVCHSPPAQQTHAHIRMCMHVSVFVFSVYRDVGR